MQVLRHPKTLKKLVKSLQNKKKTIGFVPTMGFLHEGHLSLIKKSVKDCDFTIASIFVNPLQFGPKEDFSRYPRDLARDSKLLISSGASALFLPDTNEFYPKDFQTTVTVGSLSKPLCGKSRPTHFAGVTTVVMKLLQLVEPDILYLGQKDFQQCRVLEQMIEDMALGIQVKRGAIVREPDGLAMSSRNKFLSPRERAEAVILSRTLKQVSAMIESGQKDAQKLKNALQSGLAQAKLGRVDYAEIVDARTLENVVKLHKGTQAVLALAVYFSTTRLIDNALIKVR